MNKSLRLFLGLIISFICLWVVFKGFDINTLVVSAKNVQWNWVLMALCVYMFGHVCRCVRWRLLIPANVVISYKNLFLLLMFGFFINNIMPARAGELARAAALKKNTSLSFAGSISSIVLERSSDILGILGALFIGLLISPYSLVGGKMLVVAVIGVLGGIIACIVWGDVLVHYLNNVKWLKGTAVFFDQFRQGLLAIKSWKKILAVVAVTVMIVVVEIVNLFLFARSFQIELQMIQSLTLYLGIIVGVSIPAGPGFVGTFELFASKSLEFMGYSGPQILPFVLSLHFFYLVVNSILGSMYIVKEAFFAKVIPRPLE